MDVSEFDPEFKMRMHSAAMALSESMAGRSTLFYVFSPLLKFSEQSVQQSHQTAFLHFESYLISPGIKTCGWMSTWDKITDLRNVSPEHGLY